MMSITSPPTMPSTAMIFSEAKKRSAIKPTMKGERIAPQAKAPYDAPISVPLKFSVPR
jgi:hypothetical protein